VQPVRQRKSSMQQTRQRWWTADGVNGGGK
jgi:hypothetical protein